MSYRNESNREIDCIIEHKSEVLALEVKSGRRTAKPSASAAFAKQQPQTRFFFDVAKAPL